MNIKLKIPDQLKKAVIKTYRGKQLSAATVESINSLVEAELKDFGTELDVLDWHIKAEQSDEFTSSVATIAAPDSVLKRIKESLKASDEKMTPGFVHTVNAEICAKLSPLFENLHAKVATEQKASRLQALQEKINKLSAKKNQAASGIENENSATIT